MAAGCEGDGWPHKEADCGQVVPVRSCVRNTQRARWLCQQSAEVLILSPLLSALCRYTKGLKAKDISLQFLSGKGQLKNLELNPDFLSQVLMFPPWLEVHSAKCDLIRCRVRYAQRRITHVCSAVGQETRGSSIPGIASMMRTRARTHTEGVCMCVWERVCVWERERDRHSHTHTQSILYSPLL